jgi:hypothetical protein
MIDDTLDQNRLSSKQGFNSFETFESKVSESEISTRIYCRLRVYLHSIRKVNPFSIVDYS